MRKDNGRENGNHCFGFRAVSESVSTGMIGALLGLSVWDFGSRVQRLRFEV